MEGRGGQKGGWNWIAMRNATEKGRVEYGHVGEDETGPEEGRGEEVDAGKRPTRSGHGEKDEDARRRAGTRVLRRDRKCRRRTDAVEVQ